jgi:protein-arginine kinase
MLGLSELKNNMNSATVLWNVSENFSVEILNEEHLRLNFIPMKFKEVLVEKY